MSGFGVNIVCHRGDYRYAKACCASVRRFMGDVPICVFVDGEFPVTELERAYGVAVRYPRDIQDAGLRQRSYGYGRTKMIVLFESPFERFLYLDADAVLWGDLTPLCALDGDDIIVNEPHEIVSDYIMRSQYFDPDRVFQWTARFQWRDCPFFNSGVFVARRGVVDRDEYFELLDVQERDPSLLSCGDQGILNLLVFRSAERGRLRVRQAPLQTVVPVVDRGTLAATYAFDGEGYPAPMTPGRVLHWAGPKPIIFDTQVFSSPMTWFRRDHLRTIGQSHLSAVMPWVEDLRADWRHLIPSAALDHARGIKRRLTAERAAPLPWGQSSAPPEER